MYVYVFYNKRIHWGYKSFTKCRISIYNINTFRGIYNLVIRKLRRIEMRAIVNQYKQWKQEHPDPDYQYDEMHDFIAQLSRGDLQDVFEYLEETYKN